MPTRQTRIALGDAILAALRRDTGLGPEVPDAQVVRAFVMRKLGHEGHDGRADDLGGRPRSTSTATKTTSGAR